MSRHRRHGLAVPSLDLFPFLSIFLCIMGVLAFLQTLMSMGWSSKIQLLSGSYQKYAKPYQVYCMPEGIIAIPPVIDLSNFNQNQLTSKEQDELATITNERLNKINKLAGQKAVPQVLSKEDILQILDEITQINILAKKSGSFYEEFILFGIYPGSSIHYHNFQKYKFIPKYEGLKFGYEVLDNNWHFVVNKEGNQS